MREVFEVVDQSIEMVKQILYSTEVQQPKQERETIRMPAILSGTMPGIGMPTLSITMVLTLTVTIVEE